MSRRFGTVIDFTEIDGMTGSRQVLPSSFKIPGTDVMVDIHGQPVGPTSQPGLVDQLVSWVKANPLPAVGIAAGVVYLLRRR
jgi:hypothetical protein